MKTTRRACLILLAGLVLGRTFPAKAGDTTYVWSGGYNENDFQGIIVLDSSSSPAGGGSLADIVSISLSDGSGDSYNVDLSGDAVYDFTLGHGGFRWNPTQITSMNLQEYSAASPLIGHEYAENSGEPEVDPNGIFSVGQLYNYDDYTSGFVETYALPPNYTYPATGGWFAVPDGSSTAVSLLFSAGILLGARRRLTL